MVKMRCWDPAERFRRPGVERSLNQWSLHSRLTIEASQDSLTSKNAAARKNGCRRKSHAMHGFGIFLTCGIVGRSIPFWSDQRIPVRGSELLRSGCGFWRWAFGVGIAWFLRLQTCRHSEMRVGVYESWIHYFSIQVANTCIGGYVDVGTDRLNQSVPNYYSPVLKGFCRRDDNLGLARA